MCWNCRPGGQAEASLRLVLPPVPGSGSSQIHLPLCWGGTPSGPAWTLCPDGIPTPLLAPVFADPEDLVEHVVYLVGHPGADPLETTGQWEHAAQATAAIDALLPPPTGDVDQQAEQS